MLTVEREERRIVAVVPLVQRTKRTKKKKKNKKNKKKQHFMDVWRNIIFPVRRVWLALSARLKARKNGAGLLKLQDDVQTCGYEDVQVMWEMLQRTESDVVESHHKHTGFQFTNKTSTDVLQYASGKPPFFLSPHCQHGGGMVLGR
ncbi:hypothetical protein ACSQ67_011298 [Phaseolus vulgaris]